MPTKTNNLIKDKNLVIYNILVQNVIPIASTQLFVFWNIDMLTVEVKRHNTDINMRITKSNVLTQMKQLVNEGYVILHMINGDMFFTFA